MDKPKNDLNIKKLFTLAFSSIIIFGIGLLLITNIIDLSNVVLRYIAAVISLICVITIVIFVFTFIIGLVTLIDKKK
ncbi:hypothetical protein [uncultured Clostridium sp.]|jgi:glucan phosphoethanolaminetransferase (alkaline phosphatase superfamily)|uniref:hypothetical protein n=1 Tax=uncultured Clostridium sp. TaxID=59620 RepID=UPI0026161AC4|nr:hypothetical protein [uncultured Clostridium sp.]